MGITVVSVPAGAVLYLAAVARAEYAPSLGRHAVVGKECKETDADPCGIGANNSQIVCRLVDTQVTKCTVECNRGSNDCDSYGDDMQCLILETGASVGLCAETSLLWIVGVLLSLAGSLISNFGMQIQKLGFNRHEADVSAGKATRKNPFCIPLWVAGLVGMASGAILDFGSLAFAAQSLLAPLAASTLIINIVQAPLVVNEKPTALDITCTLIIATGCVLAVGFADHDTRTYSLQDMLKLWGAPHFAIWMSIVVSGMLCAFMVILDGQKPWDGVENSKTKIEKSQEDRSNFYAVVFSSLGGQSGGNSILFAKSLSEVLKTIFQVGISFPDMLIALAMVAGLAISMFIQLKYLNNGLRFFDVLFVLPIYQAFWIGGATINGILFFEEYNNFTDTQYVMFPIGCVLTIGGVASLAAKFKQSGVVRVQSLVKKEETQDVAEVIGVHDKEAVLDDVSVAVATPRGQASPVPVRKED